ncbi:MAG: site-specific DNA-methyltransferase [Rubricoccaceae bacterium]
MELITAQDPDARSADVVADNIEKLRVLFPELITEGANGVSVNVDVLKQLVGDQTVTDADEKYGLTWHGKRRARQLALTPSTGTLRPAPEESVAWDTTQNLLIEGDNLEVLKLLQKSYAGRVKLIYIDPPYNTGNDFVYKDAFKQPLRRYEEITGQIEGGVRLTSNAESSGRFHTDWLNMIYPRLLLAWNLLRPDGAICVSIGEEELHHLRLVLDEVFGEENYRNTLLTRRYDKNINTQFADRGLPTLNVGAEYVLVYGRSDEFTLNPVYREASAERQTTGYWKGFWNAADRPTMRYPLLGVRPDTGQWKWSEAKALEAVANYEAYLASGASSLEDYWDRTGNKLKFIRRRPEGKGMNLGVEHWIPPSKGILRSSNWTDILASASLNNLDIEFSNPKNPALLSEILEMGSEPDDIVLDFFAGSGTTGHAAMEAATKEGGRRFILVQLPEPLDPDVREQKVAAEMCDALGVPRSISELTKERLRRAANQIEQNCEGIDGDLGFRVYKLDRSNIRAWSPEHDDLEQTLLDHVENLVPGRTEDDVLTELLLKLGLDLSVPVATREVAGKSVYAVGAGTLFATLPDRVADDEAEPLASGIADWWADLDPIGDSTVVARDSAFASDVAKTNFAAILEQRGLGIVRSL